MEQPIFLKVNLDFCVANEGILIHTPFIKEKHLQGFTTTFQNFGGLLDDSTRVPEFSSIILSDSDGLKLRLQVENIKGGGGQRHLVIYCPFWVVNVTQYGIRIREEGGAKLPAGTFRGERYSIHINPMIFITIYSPLYLGMLHHSMDQFKLWIQGIQIV
jgi:hypothetical protein